jgi:archaellum component FlaC
MDANRFAAFAQQLLLGGGVGELGKEVEEIEEEVEEVEEDVESLLENVRGLSVTDRLIFLQELSRIRVRLDEVHPNSPQPQEGGSP